MSRRARLIVAIAEEHFSLRSTDLGTMLTSSAKSVSFCFSSLQSPTKEGLTQPNLLSSSKLDPLLCNELGLALVFNKRHCWNGSQPFEIC